MAAGGFDPAFNTEALPSGTDVEALLRVLLRGWTVVHEPGAIVHHAHQREYLQLERRVYGYGLGLTAVLTKALIQNPRLLPDLAAQAAPRRWPSRSRRARPRTAPSATIFPRR